MSDLSCAGCGQVFGDGTERACKGVGPTTRLTVLSDGEPGLRAIQRVASPDADHVLDWFHLAMRFRHLTQLAKGIPDEETRGSGDLEGSR